MLFLVFLALAALCGFALGNRRGFTRGFHHGEDVVIAEIRRIHRELHPEAYARQES